MCAIQEKRKAWRFCRHSRGFAGGRRWGILPHYWLNTIWKICRTIPIISVSTCTFFCLVGCFVLFCFLLKDGEKSSLECQFFLFLQVFVWGEDQTPQSCLLPSVAVLSIEGCWSRVHLFTSEVLWVPVLNWNLCLRHDLRQPCRGVWRSLGFLSLLSEDFYLLTFLELCLRIGMSYFL